MHEFKSHTLRSEKEETPSIKGGFLLTPLPYSIYSFIVIYIILIVSDDVKLVEIVLDF
tara:strand:+ start:841 stop:1014 length:174 start_codon:yes stop_codon:yes gene_type:complete